MLFYVKRSLKRRTKTRERAVGAQDRKNEAFCELRNYNLIASDEPPGKGKGTPPCENYVLRDDGTFEKNLRGKEQ